VRAIRLEHLESWLASLLAAGAKLSTVNNRYRSVQPPFRWLREEGLLSDNPMANLKPPKVAQDDVAVPADADMRRLLEHTAKDKSFEGIRDLAMLRLLLGSGLVKGVRSLDDDVVGRVNGDEAQALRACVREAMLHVGGPDHDLTFAGDEPTVAEVERRLTLLDDPHLGVGMCMRQCRFTPGLSVHEDHRNWRTVVGSDEPMRLG